MGAPKNAFHHFAWDDVCAWVRAHGYVWYHAPLDIRPARVDASVRVAQDIHDDIGYTPGRELDPVVRVIPGFGSDCDPFDADSGHLERFRWKL